MQEIVIKDKVEWPNIVYIIPTPKHRHIYR